MTMGVKVYYSEISGSKEVKKRQQRVMMILDSKGIPYEAIDITEPGKEGSKDFMLSNAKPKGDSKIILSPQIFSDDLYCGDYDDFDLANENDVLEAFLNSPKIEKNVPAPAAATTTETTTNGTAASRESSIEKSSVVEAAPANGNNDNENNEADQQETTTTTQEEVTSSDTTPAAVDSTTTSDESKPAEGQDEKETEEVGGEDAEEKVDE